MVNLELKERDPFLLRRRRMVAEQIHGRKLHNPEVLSAMRTVPRHLFVPTHMQERAYDDQALPLGPHQTISQPYIVALMTQLAIEGARDKVLEIGTGSGYQAAVLAELFGNVYSIELDRERHDCAGRTLTRLHYQNVQLRIGDGRLGWPEESPYDVIIVTAGIDQIAPELRRQLCKGGRLIFPRNRPGSENQMLCVLSRTTVDHWQERDVTPVRFVPMH